MTQEEKARAYDESLERARTWQNYLYEIYENDYADELNYIFPELKESEDEDEKIRKQLLHYFSNPDNTSFEYWEGTPKEQVINWLEKQGGQKYYNLESNGKEWSEEDEIIRKTLTNIVNMFYEGCFGKAERNLLLNWLKYLKERVQPKQKWSKDDEKEWKSIVSVLTRMHFLDELDWLRSKLNR